MIQIKITAAILITIAVQERALLTHVKNAVMHTAAMEVDHVIMIAEITTVLMSHQEKFVLEGVRQVEAVHTVADIRVTTDATAHASKREIVLLVTDLTLVV